MRIALVVLVGCAGLDAGEQQLAIVGGAAAPQDVATVALVGSRGVYCSGVLLDPRHVVTAAHCLPPHIDDPVDDLTVFFGVDFSQGGPQIAVARAVAHPQWTRNSFTNDIGVIELVDASPVAAPEYAHALPVELGVGSAVRAVGYGVSETKVPGVKRTGELTIDEISERSLLMTGDGTVTCSGDSGGPLYVGGLVVGINSRSNCDSTALAERIDPHLDGFVADVVAGRALPTGTPDDDGAHAVGGGCASGHRASSWSLMIVAMWLRRRVHRS